MTNSPPPPPTNTGQQVAGNEAFYDEWALDLWAEMERAVAEARELP